MKNKKNIVVVGDKFKDFSKHEDVLIYSHLMEVLRENAIALAHVALVPGQGLSESDIENIVSMKAQVADHQINFDLLMARPARAGMYATHKRNHLNSIISTPRQIDDDCYEADLLLDERSELMNDHQTGQHIQGMVLVEAARQLFLAVTEVFFVERNSGRNYYFVINQFDTKYMAFVFPVSAVLRYEIVEKSVGNPERLSFNVRIIVQQAGVDATEVSVRFTAFLAEKIKQKEHTLAASVLEKLFQEAEHV